VITDIAIWTAPSLPVRHTGSVAVGLHADVTGRRAGDEYSEADYVPVGTYLRAIHPVAPEHTALIDVAPATRHVPAADFGHSQAGIQLYTSIFNYRGPPTGLISVRV